MKNFSLQSANNKYALVFSEKKIEFSREEAVLFQKGMTKVLKNIPVISHLKKFYYSDEIKKYILSFGKEEVNLTKEEAVLLQREVTGVLKNTPTFF